MQPAFSFVQVFDFAVSLSETLRDDPCNMNAFYHASTQKDGD